GLRCYVRLGDISGSVDFSISLEQRIAFEFPFDICGKIEVGELQQLDGLHQLRRHYEGMALPKLESLGKCHGAFWAGGCPAQPNRSQARGAFGPIFAYRLPGPLYTRIRRQARSAQGEARGIAGTTARRGTLRQDRGGGPRDRSRYRPCGPP